MTPLLVVAWAFGALDPAAFAGLAEIVGLGRDLALGVAILVGGGVVVLPALYVTLSMFLPGRTLAERGPAFATVVWTGFAVAFYTGQAGLALAAYLAVTLAAHLVYGYVVGGVYDRFAHPVEWVV